MNNNFNDYCEMIKNIVENDKITIGEIKQLCREYNIDFDESKINPGYFGMKFMCHGFLLLNEIIKEIRNDRN
jgi:hypothetical protein